MMIKILKKVKPEIHKWYNVGKEKYAEYHCSNCSAIFPTQFGRYLYCPLCGNKIDWSHIVDKSEIIFNII